MDNAARESCIRAVRLIARSARLCATIDSATPQYAAASESAQRMVDRAQGYYNTMRQGHEATERVVRLVATALVEARQCVLALTSGFVDAEDLEAMAGKIERAADRALPSVPPASAT